MNNASRRHISRRALQRRRQPHPRAGRRILWAAAGIAMVVPLLVGIVGAATALVMYNGYSEDFVEVDEVLDLKGAQLTEVYDRRGPAEGMLLGTLFNPNASLHAPVSLEEISDHMINATISTEDASYWDHRGFDPRGLARAAWENYQGGGIGTGSGGSTITQQLAKNLYLATDCQLIDGVRRCVAPKTIDRKLRELVYAVELEQRYTKEEILTYYLNQISYADRYVGVEAAANGYFRKDGADLTLPEAALLAGIPSAPTDFHPRLNCVRESPDGPCVEDEQGRWTVGGAAKERQEQVLDLMTERGMISGIAAREAKQEPLHVYPGVEEGAAPAFVDSQVEPQLVRMCRAELLPMVEGTDNCVDSVASAGYRVTTTLDWQLSQQAQQMAADRVARGIEDGCNCYNAAVATVDPRTGQLLVYVPNIDPENTGDPRVAGNIDQLTEINQPGSALKPAIYLAWFNLLDRAPMNVLWDTSPMELGPEQGFGSEVEIRNPRPGGGGEGLITARAALGGSQNVPAFRAAQEASVEGVIQVAKQLGITTLHQGFDPTFRSHESVYYGPTIATGGANIRAVDMAYMNATIANMGTMVGVPHHAETLDMSSLHDTSSSEGEAYEQALQQRRAFTRGDLRLPDSRPLDPVTILRVEDPEGNAVYEHEEPERREVIEPGDVWLLHSIMSDCTARWIIWGCGSTNDDYALDVFLDGEQIPGGVKTGTQQGPLDAADTLETWMNGYSRYGATAVWVGNANNELVRDGPAVGYAAAHTTVHIYKWWMNAYHQDVQSEEGWESPQGFDGLQPDNVTYASFRSPTTQRGHGGGCFQYVQSWQRTDIEHASDCDGRFVKLPDFKRDDAINLARQYGILTRETLPPPTPTPAPMPTQAPEPTEEPESTPEPTPEPEPTEVPEPDDPGDGEDPGSGEDSGSDSPGGDEESGGDSS